jgi:hypothetical protein
VDENSITSMIEKAKYWVDQSNLHNGRNDHYYSNLCFSKAHELAERLLSMHISQITFLSSDELEFLEEILGKDI